LKGFGSSACGAIACSWLALGVLGCSSSPASTSRSSRDAGAAQEAAAPLGDGGVDVATEAIGEGGVPTPDWLSNAKILVHGPDDESLNCREVICRHNENTDLTTFNGAIYLVHRTAMSQVLGPNSALHIYRTTDGGQHFTQTAMIDAPTDRDIRDPHFYQVGSELHIKALTRLPVLSSRDSNVDTVAVETHSSDAVHWSALQDIGPHGWSFWRIKKHAGTYYTAAYQDGDLSVVLYSSTDGVAWTAGAPIYTVSADTPLETELTFMPSGRMLALVRMDGNDQELLGDEGRLRTKICWATPPYASFDCPSEFDGERLDGPLSFFWNGRLFVIGRKHLQGTGGKKRTALYEITGNLEGGPLSIKEWGELPSAGDTSYAGIAMVDATHGLVSWYSSDLALDPAWIIGMIGPTDIWQGTIDFGKLK
jgi:hypothetical protein